MIRAILFDLDRTLLDRDQSFHQFALSQYERYSHALAAIPREIFVSRLIALDDRGRVGKDKVYRAIFDEFIIHGISWHDLFADFYARIADYYVLFPGLHETLYQLKLSGYLLGIITNGREGFQRRTLRVLDIERHFDTILISESEGIRKPEAEIFRRALHNLGCKPSEGVFIGDHPDVDIKGARESGMLTIWKKNLDFREPVPADATIDDLEEIPSLIGRLKQACPP